MSRLSSDRARLPEELRAVADRVNDADQSRRYFSNRARVFAAAFSSASQLSAHVVHL